MVDRSHREIVKSSTLSGAVGYETKSYWNQQKTLCNEFQYVFTLKIQWSDGTEKCSPSFIYTTILCTKSDNAGLVIYFKCEYLELLFSSGVTNFPL